jgi:hypothetical protein
MTSSLLLASPLLTGSLVRVILTAVGFNPTPVKLNLTPVNLTSSRVRHARDHQLCFKVRG